MPPAGETKYDVLKPTDANVPSLVSIANKQHVFDGDNLSEEAKRTIYETYVEGTEENANIIRMAKEPGDTGKILSFAFASFFKAVDPNEHPNIKSGITGPLWRIEGCFTDPEYIKLGAAKAVVSNIVRAADEISGPLTILVIPKVGSEGFWMKIGFVNPFGKDSDGRDIGFLLKRA